jgi:hypothetical protein
MDTAYFPSNEEVALPPDYTATISKALGSFIESKSATFACGGSILVSVCVYAVASLAGMTLIQTG